jgi:peptidoglycan-associated lipoprotein
MRRAILLSLPVLALALTGCPSKPKSGECKTSEDCADQEGFGKVCVEGRCQECAQDTDCKAGFVCRQNRCLPRPECEKDADCPGGRCEAGRCAAPAPRAECTLDADCGEGKACEAGTCVTRQAAAMPGCPVDGRYESVHFDFDRANIRPEDGSVLAKDAECIKQQKPRRVVVEGNCDERGTVEYNLHLGQRRAAATKKYLVNLGIPANSIKTLSYGKERPSCTESSEDCWARNRRADVRAE